MRQSFILFACVLYLSTSNTLAQSIVYSCRYFSIKYPQSWTTEVIGNPNSTSASLTEASINIKPIASKFGEPKQNIAINMDPSIDWSTIGHNELTQLKKTVTTQYQEVSFLTNPEFASYKELNGIYMEYTAIIEGYKARMMQCIIHKQNGFTYFITICVDNNKAARQLEEINGIMDTMVIK